MKRLALLIGVVTALFAARITFAQTEGVITYEVTINNHRTLPADRQGMKAMIPEFRVFKQELFFNANESLYKPLIEDEEEEQQGPGQGGRFRARMRGAVNYFDQTTGIFLSQMDLMGKKYIITDTLKTTPWKFGTDTKMIQGYECAQAYYTTAEEKKQTITAWYTMKLRPMLGPEKYNTLPGAVLAVDINNAERVLVAKKIEIRPLKKDEVKVPADGQKVTQAEFHKIGEDMRGRFGNSRGARVRND